MFEEMTSEYDRDSHIAFLENSLELDIIDRDVAVMWDRLVLLPYYEDSSESGDDNAAAKSGILKKIQESIEKIIDKIREILTGATRALQNIGKDRITCDDYKNSSTGQAELQKKLDKCKQEIDATFLEMRPVISTISKVLHMDPTKVESACDNINRTIANVNWGAVLKTGILAGAFLYTHTNKYKGELNKATDAVEAAKKRLENAKEVNAQQKLGKTKALNKVSMTLANVTNAIFGAFNKKGGSLEMA